MNQAKPWKTNKNLHPFGEFTGEGLAHRNNRARKNGSRSNLLYNFSHINSYAFVNIKAI